MFSTLSPKNFGANMYTSIDAKIGGSTQPARAIANYGRALIY